MRIYEIQYTEFVDDVEVSRRVFEISEEAAAKCSEALKKRNVDSLPYSRAIDVPTDGVALIAWLNENASFVGVVIP